LSDNKFQCRLRGSAVFGLSRDIFLDFFAETLIVTPYFSAGYKNARLKTVRFFISPCYCSI
jgi:hypothetical protein